MTATHRAESVLPTGTVTFLFTDIEGSTKLWETQRPAMQTALARHDALLRQAIERHHGHVVKTTGDGACAASLRLGVRSVGGVRRRAASAGRRAVAGPGADPRPHGLA